MAGWLTRSAETRSPTLLSAVRSSSRIRRRVGSARTANESMDTSPICSTRHMPVKDYTMKSAITLATCDGYSNDIMCGASGSSANRAPGIRSANARSADGGPAWSTDPATTSVGDVDTLPRTSNVLNARHVAAQSAGLARRTRSRAYRTPEPFTANAPGVNHRVNVDGINDSIPSVSPARARASNISGAGVSVVPSNVSDATRDGSNTAAVCATAPPNDNPTTCAPSNPSASRTPTKSCAYVSIDVAAGAPMA